MPSTGFRPVELPKLGVFVNPVTVFIGGIFVPGNLGAAPCEMLGATPCGMMSELDDEAPTDAPAGTLPLDKAKGKFGLSKDDVHKIKDNATGHMGTGRTWIGVAPNGEVGTSENGNWTPQGTLTDLRH
jgi:hypothetical protein